VSFVQPVSATSSTARPAARGTQRRDRPARPLRGTRRLGVNENAFQAGVFESFYSVSWKQYRDCVACRRGPPAFF
jgi:hypothetical protein